MKKAVIFCLLPVLLFCSANLAAQKVLHSNKDLITIRFNEYNIVWHLQPELNPDVFTVGATFKTKRVSVVTALDSISYILSPGQQVNLVVYLDKIPCHILIAASPNPLFLRPLAAVLAVVITVFFLVLTARSKGIKSSKYSLAVGSLAPVVFWIVTIIAGWIHGNYNHLHNAVSELGTIGTRSEYFMAVCTLLIGMLAAVFSIGFVKASQILRINRLPAMLSFAMPVSLFWAGVFSSGHELHGALGPLPLLMMVGVLIAVIAWPKDNTYTTLRKHAAISLLIMCIFFFKIAPGIIWPQKYEGALQRCMYTGWTYWVLVVSFYLRKKLNTLIDP